MKQEKQPVKLMYLGGPGSDFGFKLAGIETTTCESSDQVLAEVKKVAGSDQASIIFIDEGMVEREQEELADLSQSAACAVVLLPSPTKPKRLAAKQMDRLMIQAVGSDIFSNK